MKRIAHAAVAALLLSACLVDCGGGGVSAVPPVAAPAVPAAPIATASAAPAVKNTIVRKAASIASTDPSGFYVNGTILASPAAVTQTGSTPNAGATSVSIVVTPHLQGYTGISFQIVNQCADHSAPTGFSSTCRNGGSYDDQSFFLDTTEQARIFCSHGLGTNGACIDEGQDPAHPGNEIYAGDEFTVTFTGPGVSAAGTWSTGFTFEPYEANPPSTIPHAELLVNWATTGASPTPVPTTAPTPAPTASPTPAPTPTPTGERATPADTFVDSIGVNSHFNYSNTPYYTQFSQVESLLVSMGVRHIRCGDSTGTDSTYAANIQKLHADGIDCVYVVQIDNSTTANPLGDRYVQSDFDSFVSTMHVTARDAFEGPNELNISGRSNWVTLAQQSAQVLQQMMHANPATVGLKEIGPSMTSSSAYATVGDLSAFIDHPNMHNYAGGKAPEDPNFIPPWLTGAKAMSPAPPWTTETGYCERGGTTTVPPLDVNDIYLSRDYLEQYRDGIPRTYKYEFVSADTTGTGQFDQCGLVNTDLSPKPSYHTISNEIAALSDPGYSFTPGMLAWSMTGDTSSIHHLLLQKHDGTFDLLLWSADPVWVNDVEVYPAPHSITVNLSSATATSAETFVKDGTVKQLGLTGHSLPLSIGSTPTLVIAK